LNFWATWCPPCRFEMPSMEKLHKNMKGRDFIMLAVNLKESREKVRKFVNKYELTFEVLLDFKGDVQRKYGAFSIPVTYIIGQDGKFLGAARGPRDWASQESTRLFKMLSRFKRSAIHLSAVQSRRAGSTHHTSPGAAY